MKQNFFILIGIFFLLELYVYQAFKTLVASSYGRAAYIAVTLAIYGLVSYNLALLNKTSETHRLYIVTTLFFVAIVPKILVTLFLLVDDISRVFQWIFLRLSSTETHYPERRKFLSLLGLGTAGVISALVLDGVVFGKYRHKVRKVKLTIKNLPKSFKGYKIIQISDVHSGSFSNPEKLRGAINLINGQNADLVLFTGDMVNNEATEFAPMVDLFKSIKAKDGKFSVLGNHDYGEYIQWESQKAKTDNLQYLIDLQTQAGFQLLRNEHRAIEKNGERIYILGVENWGSKPFPQYGDLDRAVAGIPQNAPKILMSHDPTHFDEKVKHHPADIALTLSGHTHGMQFGLDLKNHRWSPVQYRYPKWADLYESNGKYLYVNRGFGVIGFSGRVGMLPEITLIELQ